MFTYGNRQLVQPESREKTPNSKKEERATDVRIMALDVFRKSFTLVSISSGINSLSLNDIDSSRVNTGTY